MKHRFFEMNLFNVIRVGGQSLMVMLFTLSSSFITAYLVGKAIKIDGKTTTLIGVGTSICGGSAIAATAPVIQAKDEDVAQAISTIFLFNIIAVFIFPPLGHLLGLSDTGFGMWTGTAIGLNTNIKGTVALSIIFFLMRQPLLLCSRTAYVFYCNKTVFCLNCYTFFNGYRVQSNRFIKKNSKLT